MCFCSTKKPKKNISTQPPATSKPVPKYQPSLSSDPQDLHSTNVTNHEITTYNHNTFIAEMDNFIKQRSTKASSTQQEQEFVNTLIKQSPNTHIISYQWAFNYTEYLQGNEKHPGSIRNSDLDAKIKSGENVTVDIDYVLINEHVWYFIQKLYKGGPEILLKDIPPQIKQVQERPQLSQPINKQHSNSPDKSQLAGRHAEIKNSNVAPPPAAQAAFRHISKIPSRMLPVVGLQNDIFFCYLNSVLQCLMGIPQLNYTVLSLTGLADNMPFLSAYQSLLKRALKGPQCAVVTPRELQRVLQKNFNIYEMHDSSELLLFLIDKLREECAASKIDSFMDEFFQGQIQSSIVCPNCQVESTKLDLVYDLSLPLTQKGFLEKKLSLAECINNYFKEETIEGGWTCGQCNNKTDKTRRRLKFLTTPNILAVHLKRFAYYPKQKKIDEPVSLSFHIDLKNHCVEPKDEKYQLIGMILHQGTIYQGHYIAVVKREKQFVYFNDESLQQFHENQIAKIDSAYLLIYQKL